MSYDVVNCIMVSECVLPRRVGHAEPCHASERLHGDIDFAVTQRNLVAFMEILTCSIQVRRSNAIRLHWGPEFEKSFHDVIPELRSFWRSGFEHARSIDSP